jgi:protein phosphatase
MFEPSISSTQEESPALPAIRGLTHGEASHRGRLRENNEDHHGSAVDLGFFVVADGVGGAPAGAVASRLATAAMLYALRVGAPAAAAPSAPAAEPRAATEVYGPRLVAAAHQAHKMICDFANKNDCHGAATTMASLWVAGGHAVVANTGDSRVYRLAGDGLEQLSRDHSAVQAHLDRHGHIAEIWAKLLENVVTQVLGGKSQRPPAVHLAAHPIQKREVFLLCTDGLTKMVSEGDIAFVLEHTASPQQAARILIEIANAAGGLDNITCIVVHVEPPSGPVSSPVPSSLS